MSRKDFRKLLVWEKAHAFTKEVYKSTVNFPQEEKFGIISQIRRAAVSVPCNLAEGCGRGGNIELARFVTIASGSASESEYLLQLSHELDFLDKEKYFMLNNDINEVKRMLNSLETTLRKQ